MSKKKYFYDPILEKAILNNVTALDKDSSMDNEDYKDVCFCPSNNKLYAVRVNSATSAGTVDVICPNATTESQTPQASITVGDNACVILYCPTVRRIFAIAPNKYYIINPRDNTVDVEINHGQASNPSCAVYNPILNKIHVGFVASATGGGVIINIAPGNINYIDRHIGIQSPAIDLTSIEGLTQITGICLNPELNYLYFFDGGQAKGGGTGAVVSSAIEINVSKDSVGVQDVSYVHYLGYADWLAHGQSIRDSIYCPFNGAEYWLSSPDNGTDGETRVYAMGGYTYPMSQAPSLAKTINISPAVGGGNYNKLIYCTDNNMIYVIGDNHVQMINPADTKGIMPVARWKSFSGIPNNDVCYSPVNNRIYGVGDAGAISYIDVTS